MNMYAYVGNDPVNATDPSGMLTVQFEICIPMPGYSNPGPAPKTDDIVVTAGRMSYNCTTNTIHVPDPPINGLAGDSSTPDRNYGTGGQPQNECKIPMKCLAKPFSLVLTKEKKRRLAAERLARLEREALRAQRLACMAAFRQGMLNSVRGGIVGGIGGAAVGAAAGEGFGPLGAAGGFLTGVWNGGFEAAEQSPNCK